MHIMAQRYLTTKRQLEINEKLQELHEQKAQLLSEGVAWRSKQSDIPALERQMRAKVARAQMEKTKVGKDILKSMMDNLDDTVNLIGI